MPWYNVWQDDPEWDGVSKYDPSLTARRLIHAESFADAKEWARLRYGPDHEIEPGPAPVMVDDAALRSAREYATRSSSRNTNASVSARRRSGPPEAMFFD
jgi:hypothetical protein